MGRVNVIGHALAARIGRKGFHGCEVRLNGSGEEVSGWRVRR